MENNKKIVLTSLMLSIFIGYFSFSYNTPPDAEAIKDQTFSYLENVLDTKRHRAVSYLKKQKSSAINITSDPDILARFQKLNHLFHTNGLNTRQAIEADHALQEIFVAKLGDFYDMLFVNRDGDFFYTVKKENDFGKNISHPQFSGLSLQKQISKKYFSFIDYEFYSASKEPASFYLFPVYIKNKFVGQIILQLSINKINDIFVDRSELGETGEVYLVNDSQMMLTDSRFIDTTTVLNKRIDTAAIKYATDVNKGNRIIKDYRGKNVFSVFEKFQIENVKWIIVSEIDEDEILSRHYKKYESNFYPEFFEKLISSKNNANQTPLESLANSSFKKVDVKEFIKTRKDAGLYTKGVATCTAFGVQYPGEFSYLAHLSPTDATYNDGWLQKYVLGDQYTNYVDLIMRKIHHYDIRPHELSNLKISIGAPDNSAFRGIIKRLLNHGVFLNQIEVHQKSGQYSMDMVLDHRTGSAESRWYSDQENGGYGISLEGLNLLTAFKQHIGYQS